MLGIIGGTGLTQLANLTVTKRQIIRTPYGEPSAPLVFGEIGGREVVFLALHSEGVRDIIAVATVGGIHPDLGPGRLALPEQILDYTHGRNTSFHEGIEFPVRHIDFTEPYSQRIRELCKQAAIKADEPLFDGGVYAAVQGPRLETAAEINRLERDGATMVGMTGMPEAALARELDIEYAAICPVANHAAGRGSSLHGIRYEDIGTVLAETMQRVRLLLEQMVVLHGR